MCIGTVWFQECSLGDPGVHSNNATRKSPRLQNLDSKQVILPLMTSEAGPGVQARGPYVHLPKCVITYEYHTITQVCLYQQMGDTH